MGLEFAECPACEEIAFGGSAFEIVDGLDRRAGKREAEEVIRCFGKKNRQCTPGSGGIGRFYWGLHLPRA
jgi:hypothetical protein